MGARAMQAERLAQVRGALAIPKSSKRASVSLFDANALLAPAREAYAAEVRRIAPSYAKKMLKLMGGTPPRNSEEDDVSSWNFVDFKGLVEADNALCATEESARAVVACSPSASVPITFEAAFAGSLTDGHEFGDYAAWCLAYDLLDAILLSGALPSRVREGTLNWYVRCAFPFDLDTFHREKLDNLRRAVEEVL